MASNEKSSLEGKSIHISDYPSHMTLQTIFLQAKLDTLMEANAYIISKLDNTDFQDEYEKLTKKVKEHAEYNFHSLNSTDDENLDETSHQS